LTKLLIWLFWCIFAYFFFGVFTQMTRNTNVFWRVVPFCTIYNSRPAGGRPRRPGHRRIDARRSNSPPQRPDATLAPFFWRLNDVWTCRIRETPSVLRLSFPFLNRICKTDGMRVNNNMMMLTTRNERIDRIVNRYYYWNNYQCRTNS